MGNSIIKWAPVLALVGTGIFIWLGISGPVQLDKRVTVNETKIDRIEKDITQISKDVRDIHQHLLGTSNGSRSP